jgi:hypothetical protein
MSYPTAPIHLYKLVTGESLIGYFFGQEETNARTGTKAHRIKYPLAVNEHYECHEWIIGLHPDEMEIMLPMSSIITYAEQDKIDPSLVEIYQELQE